MNYKNFLKLTINLLLIISLLGAGFCFPRLVKAQEELSNLRILYQGNLSDSEGNPVEDGRYNIRFRIYDVQEEGDILWLEEYTFYNAIFVKDGQFKIILGRTDSIHLNLDQPSFWLGITIGNSTDEGEITWNEEMKPRKRIITLSELLKEEGLSQLEEDGLTEEEWEIIFQLIEEKLKTQPDLVILFNIEQLKETGTEIVGDFGSKLFDVLKNLINFISEKLSEIGEKIDNVLTKLEDMSSILADMKQKIDVLYDVLVVDKGLAPVEIETEQMEDSSEGINYSKQKIERLIFREGETSARISNQLIEKESLIFVSFLDEPTSSWWISEKIPGYSFTISLKEPASQDLRFDYWILDPVGDKVPNTCDSIHLALCLNETDCKGANGYWYDSICNSEPREESVPSVTFLNTPCSGKVGEEITFNVTTLNFATDTLAFNWDFGDGNLVTTNQPTVTYIYKSAGTFTISLAVTGGTNQANASILIEIIANLPPDTDEDGIPDSKDTCPDIPGDYCRGCPEPECNGDSCQNSVCPETGPPICQDDNSLCAVPNAVGVCKDGTCSFTCKDGCQDCNDDWSDGCETASSTCPAK